MVNIWVYIGVIGSGKDYTANKKKEATGGVICSFSEGVRDYTWSFLDWKPTTPEEYEQFKYHKFRIPMPNGEIVECDGRKFLENIGFKLRKFDNEFWSKLATREVNGNISRHIKDIIIYDCRYLEEAQAMEELRDEEVMVKYIFCNYDSPRKEVRNDDSEKFAQYFLNKGHKDGEDITSEVIKLILES